MSLSWCCWQCPSASVDVQHTYGYCRDIHAAILELGSWHWEKRNSYLCKTLFLVQCPGLVSLSLLSNQGSSSLINWILLKAEKTAPSLVITSVASPKFLTDWIAKKSMPTWRCTCHIYIYIATWFSLFMCHRGPRNRISLGQKFLPLANPWSRVAWEWGRHQGWTVLEELAQFSITFFARFFFPVYFFCILFSRTP